MRSGHYCRSRPTARGDIQITFWFLCFSNEAFADQDAYAELVKLAVERRARLEESRKLWQFYWDMADEENWIKEKEHILSTGDIGHDLTTIHLLISKHKALEEDIASHEPTLYSVVNVGEELIQQEHFGTQYC